MTSIEKMLRRAVENTPLLSSLASRAYGAVKRFSFPGSSNYWERRYQDGGNSGIGSYGRLARFKADFLNGFVEEHEIRSVIEFGCGDGAQLELAAYPRYLGLDVSSTAITMCRGRFKGDETKSFELLRAVDSGSYEVSLSLDVIYHLVEDEVFESHMAAVFDAASRYVVVYSSNSDQKVPTPHVRHREFTRWVFEERPEWKLMRQIPNAFQPENDAESETSFADFYLFGKA